MLVLISDFDMLEKYCVVNEDQLKYLKKVWFTHRSLGEGGPGPVTIILENLKNLPDELTGGLNSLAVRLPDNEFLIKMIKQVGFPIVSTSLNKAGESPLKNVINLEKHFEVLPDLAIDAGECTNFKPSRLVDLREVEKIKVIRE